MAAKRRPAQDLAVKVEELTSDLKRVQADFINFRNRSEEERGQVLTLAKQDVILHILPLLDSIDRAFAHIPQDLVEHPWAKGVKQIARQAEEIFRSMGVERIVALDQIFDPLLHEAVGFVDGEGETEVVTEELQPGWRVGETVLRPAMVKVGKK